jgi:hypothetical protein
VTGPFKQRHEAWRPLEHELQPFVLAAEMRKLVQHDPMIQQRASFVTALVPAEGVIARPIMTGN